MPAKELHEALLKEVRDWVGDTPQFDDITLIVLGREKVTDKGAKLIG